MNAKEMNQNGMTLIELLLAAGIVSIVALGAGMQMLRTNASFDRAKAASTVSQTQSLMSRWLSLEKVGPSVTCAQILKISSSTPQAANSTQVPVEIHDPSSSVIYSQAAGQNTISGAGKFTITNLYLDDSTQVRTEPGGLKVYTSTLWLEGAAPGQQVSTRRAVTALTLKRDPSGTIVDCNTVTDQSQETYCSDLSTGFSWNGASCQSTVQRHTDGTIVCGAPGLFLTSSGQCVPHNQACPTGQIAQNFYGNSVTGCTVYQ